MTESTEVPRQTLPDALHRWTAAFSDPAVEHDYRHYRLPEQRRRGIALAGVVAVLPGLSLITEVPAFLDGDATLAATIIARLLVIFGSLAMMLLLWRTQEQKHAETALTVYGVLLVAVSVHVVALHPGMGLMAPTSAVAMVTLISFFAPLQFPATIALATLMAVGGWIGWVVVRGATSPEDAFRLTLWIVSVTLVGMIGSYTLHRTLRALFWERRQLAQQKTLAEAAYQRERRALEQFRQFAELISHEFRNPLAIVKNKAQLLQLMAATGTRSEPDALPAIERAANRLDALFRQWLSSDRLTGDAMAVDARPVPVRDLVRLVIDEMTAPPQHTIRLVSATPNMIVNGDPNLLCTALLNLLDNAVKYSPHGGLIELSASRSGGEAVITVKDNGIGIAATNQEQVFEKYCRVKHDGAVRGFGLGLFLVRRIIGVHGGTVSVESELGRGSTFFVRLPLMPEGALAG